MTVINESIMKTDRLGRLRYTPEQKKGSSAESVGELGFG